MIRWQVAEEVFFQGQTASHSQWLLDSILHLTQLSWGWTSRHFSSFCVPHCWQTNHLFCRWNSVIYEATWQADHQPCHKYVQATLVFFWHPRDKKNHPPICNHNETFRHFVECPRNSNDWFKAIWRSLGGVASGQSLSHVSYLQPHGAVLLCLNIIEVLLWMHVYW